MKSISTHYIISILVLSFVSLFFSKAPSLNIMEMIFLLLIINSAYTFFYLWLKKRTNYSFQFVFFLIYLVSLFFVIWIHYYAINTGNEIEPSLPGDGLNYFSIGRDLAITNQELTSISLNYVGYPLVLSWIFKFFGSHLAFGLIFNWVILLLNIFLVAESTYLLTSEKKHFSTTIILLILTSQFVATGFMLLKDVFIVLSVVMALYSSVLFSIRKKKGISLFLLFVSILIMSLFRVTFIFVPIIVFFTLIKNYSRSSLFIIPVLFLLIYIGITLGDKYAISDKSIESSIEHVQSNRTISKRLDESSGGVVDALFSGYDSWSVTRKVIYLPISVGVQLLTPFDVINLSYFKGFPYFIISRNYNIIWLLFIVPLILFALCNIKYLNIDNHIKRIAILGFILYMIPAFIYAGAIPRYAVPFYGLFFPFVAICFDEIKLKHQLNKKWRKFRQNYFLFLSVALLGYLFFKAF